jgi:hypothetical protein
VIEIMQAYITGFPDEEEREHRNDAIKRITGRHVVPFVKNVLADETR